MFRTKHEPEGQDGNGEGRVKVESIGKDGDELREEDLLPILIFTNPNRRRLLICNLCCGVVRIELRGSGDRINIVGRVRSTTFTKLQRFGLI